jgi:hypothetical protein
VKYLQLIQHSLGLNDPVYVSTMQQASGYCTR